MTWFKVDDRLWGHPKWMALPAGARALWVTAGSYCASNETDGLVPAAVLPMLGGRRRDAEILVEAGLWDHAAPEVSQKSAKDAPNLSQKSATGRPAGRARKSTPSGRTEPQADAYIFHDWQDYQPTKAQVRAEREAVKERQRRWREGRAARRNDGVSNGVTNASRNGVTNGAPTRPDPTLSPPTPSDTAPQATAPTPADAGRERDKPNGHTPARQLAATLLSIDPTDPRLDGLPDILASHNVRSPAAWLRTAAANGDLEELLDTAPVDTDPWAHLPKNVTPPSEGVPMPEHVRAALQTPASAATSKAAPAPADTTGRTHR